MVAMLTLMLMSMCTVAGARVRLPTAGACVWAAAGRCAQGEAVCAGHHCQRPRPAADRACLLGPLWARLQSPGGPQPTGTPCLIPPMPHPCPTQQILLFVSHLLPFHLLVSVCTSQPLQLPAAQAHVRSKNANANRVQAPGVQGRSNAASHLILLQAMLMLRRRCVH